MKRFRINKEHEILINLTCNGRLIYQSIRETGFTSILQAQNFAKGYLPWNYKGYGRRIEIAIHNLDTQESKYISTFS
jgi:hypothetical protein